MDGQELYNLYEAYVDVYQEQELDEATRMRKEFEREHGKQKGKEKETLIRRKLAPKDKQEDWTKSYWKRVLGSDHHLRTVRKLSREQVDLYDIILSHLLDEGYAETVDAAEAMMVNMSEEWRDSILSEGEKPLPYGRMMKKSNELADSDDKEKRKRAAKIYLAANSPKGPKVKIRK